MKDYAYKNKDKLVYIFSMVSQDVGYNEIVRKRMYFNAEHRPFKAYVRSTSAKERDSDNTVYPYNEIEVVINYRPELERVQDSYIEMDGKTYAITGIDCLDFRHTEMKIRAVSVDLGGYDTAEYREAFE